MPRPSISRRQAKEIVERSGGDRVRRGESDRLEVGSGGLFERTEGTRVLRVGGTLSESTGGTHTTRAKRVERTVRGRARINGRTDNIILGGGMSEVHAGAELVLAGMSDGLVIGAGTRVTGIFDLWVTGLLGMEEKLATSNFDGVMVDTARTLFEREYGTGVHHAGSATFSGAVYATQATGFRKLMKVSSGVRTVDFDAVTCPAKVLGADPTVRNSFMPSMDLAELVALDYDFIPETSHFLQLEEPEECAARTLEFLKRHDL